MSGAGGNFPVNWLGLWPRFLRPRFPCRSEARPARSLRPGAVCREANRGERSRRERIEGSLVAGHWSPPRLTNLE